MNETLAAYIECALWSSVDWDTGDNLDALYGVDDLAEESLATMALDVASFVEGSSGDIAALDPGQVGHDFWITRNHHGAGFWDRGLGDVGDRLTEAAHAYGSQDIYVGDDGRLHVT